MTLPWNLVLWNIARYKRAANSPSEYIKYYRRAIELTRENKSNVTMYTFAASMSADRLLWCREHETTDATNAQAEFDQICKDLQKIGMTDEMKSVFPLTDIKKSRKIPDEDLRTISFNYLK